MSALEQSLISDIPRLTPDEQAALRFVLDRILVVGRRDYAPWKAEGDARDMEKEIADELADAIVYTGMRAVMRSVAKRRRIECFKHDAAIAAIEPSLAELAAFDVSDGGWGVSKRQRAQVVELLRCAADLGFLGVACPLSEASWRTGSRASDIERISDECVGSVVDESENPWTTEDWSDYATHCLEAALRVEEGWTP